MEGREGVARGDGRWGLDAEDTEEQEEHWRGRILDSERLSEQSIRVVLISYFVSFSQTLLCDFWRALCIRASPSEERLGRRDRRCPPLPGLKSWEILELCSG